MVLGYRLLGGSDSMSIVGNNLFDDGCVVIRVLSNVLNRLIDVNQKSHNGQHFVTKFQSSYAPSITILTYLERIRKYARCSDSCFIVALIYIDRIIEIRNVVLTSLNVHRILITSVLVAAKFFDDEFYNNAFYAKLGGVPAWEMNSLELEFLHLVNFSLYVSADAFSKYHSELRNYLNVTEIPTSSPISVATATIMMSPTFTRTPTHSVNNQKMTLTPKNAHIDNDDYDWRQETTHVNPYTQFTGQPISNGFLHHGVGVVPPHGTTGNYTQNLQMKTLTQIPQMLHPSTSGYVLSQNGMILRQDTQLLQPTTALHTTYPYYPYPIPAIQQPYIVPTQPTVGYHTLHTTYPTVQYEQAMAIHPYYPSECHSKSSPVAVDIQSPGVLYHSTVPSHLNKPVNHTVGYEVVGHPYNNTEHPNFPASHNTYLENTPNKYSTITTTHPKTQYMGTYYMKEQWPVSTLDCPMRVATVRVGTT